jgi:alcohol dehydrogenase
LASGLVTQAAVLREVNRRPPYVESRPLSIEEVELEPPRRGEVLVRIASAGLCHSDLSGIDGTIGKVFPIVMGHEAAGVVEEVGPDVTAVKPGDHVVFSFIPTCGQCAMCAQGRPALCVPGIAANLRGELLGGGVRFRAGGVPAYHHLGVSGFSRLTVCAQESLVPIPPDVPLGFAAVFGCAALTGLGAVFNTADVRPGQRVAIFGAGGVGLMALLAAVCIGATAVVVDPLERKRTLARELGAAFTVDPLQGEPAVQIRELTHGAGVDVAIEASGNARVVADAFSATAPGGTTVAIGLPKRDTTIDLSPFALVTTERTVKGSFMGSGVPRRDIPRYVDLWRRGRLPVERLVTNTIGLDELNAGFDALAAGEVVRTVCAF